MTDSHATAAAAILRRYSWLLRIRPQAVASLVRRVLVRDARFIVSTNGGLRLYIDPFSNFGSAILTRGEYEPDTGAFFRRYVRPGDTVWDVGANEGYFAVLAARLVGPSGRVIAVEPQTRLQDVIEINLSLNGVASWVTVRRAALGQTGGQSVRLNLSTEMNSGSSSIVAKYRWSRAFEEVPTITPADVARASGRQSVDFIKVDVEGFESQVVPALAPLIRENRVGRLLLDFHAPQLARQGASAAALHAQLVAMGLSAATPFNDWGYVLYESSIAR